MKSQLDLDHVREKQKDLQEKEKRYEEQKELQRQLQKDIEDKKKSIQMLNTEIKTKQQVLKRHNSTTEKVGGQQQNLQDEIQIRNNQIDILNDRLIVQDHELKELREEKKSIEQLKKLEKELDSKDHSISELKKKIMIQEEAISSWIEALDEKKRVIVDKDKRCVQLEEENGSLMTKNVEHKEKLEALEEKNKKLLEEQKVWKDEKMAFEEQIKKLGEEVKEANTREKEIEDLKMHVKNQQQEIETMAQQAKDQDHHLKETQVTFKSQLSELQSVHTSNLSHLRGQNESLEQELTQVKAQYEKYKRDREIEDMLVVKFDIKTFDEKMLSAKDTKIEDLEKEKIKLEQHISEITKDFDIVLSDKNQLAQKIDWFQQKCQHLEQEMSKSLENSSEEIKELKRQKIMLTDKNQNLEQSYKELKELLEKTIQEKHSESNKLKKELEASVQKERDRANGLEKQFKKSLMERDALQAQLKDFYQQLEKVEQKIQVKQEEVAQKDIAVAKAQKQVEEMKALLQKQKKTHSGELENQERRTVEKDAEIQVLKEMVKGIKLQLKSKDTDIQRLQIKIKRLEKTNEIRDHVIMETSHKLQKNSLNQNSAADLPSEYHDNAVSVQDENQLASQQVSQKSILPPIPNNYQSKHKNSVKNTSHKGAPLAQKGYQGRMQFNSPGGSSASVLQKQKSTGHDIGSIHQSRHSQRRDLGNIGIRDNSQQKRLPSLLDNSFDQKEAINVGYEYDIDQNKEILITSQGVIDPLDALIEQQREIRKEFQENDAYD